MKILVFGGKGMAGHVITKYFKNKEYEVFYTSRDICDKEGIYLDVTENAKVERIIEDITPDVMINCIGILNREAEENPIHAFQVNSLFPQRLVRLSEKYGGKVIQISTDCVFSGRNGDYTEQDLPDGTSIYSQSKQLGEVMGSRHLTIRTSIIGPELKEDGVGLFIWFMKQTGTIKGYKNAFWNGVTTLQLAKTIEEMIQENVSGLFHLSTEGKISKFDLLTQFLDVFEKKDVEIIPDENLYIDRSLKTLRTDCSFELPSYKEMLLDMKNWMKKQ